MGRCVCSEDVCVEVREGRVVVASWAFTLEIEVEGVRSVRVLRWSSSLAREC